MCTHTNQYWGTRQCLLRARYTTVKAKTIWQCRAHPSPRSALLQPQARTLSEPDACPAASATSSSRCRTCNHDCAVHDVDLHVCANLCLYRYLMMHFSAIGKVSALHVTAQFSMSSALKLITTTNDNIFLNKIQLFIRIMWSTSSITSHCFIPLGRRRVVTSVEVKPTNNVYPVPMAADAIIFQSLNLSPPLFEQIHFRCW